MVNLKEIKGTDKSHILCNIDILMKAGNVGFYNAYVYFLNVSN